MPALGRRSLALFLCVLLAVLSVGAYLAVRRLRADSQVAAAEEAIARRDFREASRLLDHHLEKSPRDLESRMLAAQTARRQRDYEAANRHLRGYEQHGGPRGALRLEYELLVVQRGDVSEAPRLFAFCSEHREAAETPLVVEAIIVGCLDSLAPIFTPMDPFRPGESPPTLDLAARAIELWLELRPAAADQAQGLAWRGRARTLLGDHTRVMPDLRRALELDPENFEAAAHLAAFQAEQDPIESLARFDDLARRYPDDLRLQFARVTGRRGLGRLDEARQILEPILATQPRGLHFFLLERGLVDVDAQQPAAAEGWLRQALAAAPNEADVHLALSRCLQLLGKSAEAKIHRDRFLELDAERTSQRLGKARSATP